MLPSKEGICDVCQKLKTVYQICKTEVDKATGAKTFETWMCNPCSDSFYDSFVETFGSRRDPHAGSQNDSGFGLWPSDLKYQSPKDKET